jgi:hypothetical protein
LRKSGVVTAEEVAKKVQQVGGRARMAAALADITN